MQNPSITALIGNLGRFYAGERSDSPLVKRCLQQFAFDTKRAPQFRKEWIAALRYAAIHGLRLKVPYSAGRPRTVRFHDILTPRDCKRTANLLRNHFGREVAHVRARRPRLDLCVEFIGSRRGTR